MDVARINFSHGDHLTHAASIAALKQVAEEEKQPVSVLADLQGPKLRVGEITGSGMQLREGAQVTLIAGSGGPTSEKEIPVPHRQLLRELHTGDTILLDDGNIELAVITEGKDNLLCKVVVGGLLTSHKGINIPGTALGISALTDKDKEDALFAIKQGIDFLALSFVRRPEEIRDLHQFLRRNGADVPIIAKIEKPEALQHFDEILSEAYGIMVARGDLGVETPAEEVPFHQKEIIRACNRVGKPVITATQMLQSMITHTRPTRAEASDVANAILDGTDAVMLSGETAIGQYPVEATRTMAKICLAADAHLVCADWLRTFSSVSESITGSISKSAVRTALEIDASAIVTATMSGVTARMVTRFRPPMPVLALTHNKKTARRLALSWGVMPILVPRLESADETMHLATRVIAERGLAKAGDRIVLTAGIPFGTGGKTNMLKVTVIDEDQVPS